MLISVFLKKEDVSNEIFEINQTNNLDLYLNFPASRTIYLPRKRLREFEVGDKIQVNTEDLMASVDHFSAHKSGQRHIKFSKTDSPVGIVSGSSIAEINRPIPLVTMVASVSSDFHKEPFGNNWNGLNLPSETNYALIDLVAAPKNSNLIFNMDHEVTNKKKSTETFGQISIEMKNCRVHMFIRTSNYSLADPQSNLIFLQDEGVTFSVTRVEGKTVRIQVAEMLAGKV